MAVTLEQVVEAVKVMVDNISQLSKNSGHRGGSWNDPVAYKNIMTFGGDSKNWEEFSEKFKSQVVARNIKMMEVMKEAEVNVDEESVQTADGQ